MDEIVLTKWVSHTHAQRGAGLRLCRMGDSPAFVGMVLVVLAQVGNMLISKVAMSRGLSNFVIVVYSNVLSTLILFPSSFIFHRSQRPPLTLSILCSFFLLALIGCSVQIFTYAGVQYSSPTLGTAMVNLIPAFTFILAIIFRMEKLDWRSSSSQAKSVGTLVSITGAFIVTVYKGPPIITTPSLSGSPIMTTLPLSGSPHQFLISPRSNWILGGFFLAADALMSSVSYIVLASILKKYPAVLIVASYYCFFVTIQSAIVTLILEKNPSAWRLRPDMGLIAILYSGVIGNAFRMSTTTWCLQRTGPLYISMFKPLGIVMAVVMGVILLRDTFYLGSLVGAIVIVIGFYAVMWGKAKEENIGRETGEGTPESSSLTVSLLHNKIEEI